MEIHSSEVLENLLNSAEISTDDYADILNRYQQGFTRVNHFLQVGQITQTQGWILHISVIRSELFHLLDVIIPFLLPLNVPFKIAKDKDTARDILDGRFGKNQIGKVIKIYPHVDHNIIELTRQLIRLTIPFKGPAILTDAHLGSQIYTRYGGFNPIIMSSETGDEVSLIYDPKGNLVRDEYSIPFSLPNGIEWPFLVITGPITPKTKKDSHWRYRSISNLKTDPRGNVTKALYLHRLFNVKWCVIKEGTKYMWSDDDGRDMTHRLEWQKKLTDELSKYISLPKVLDFFSDEDQAYLVMDLINGKSLMDAIHEINKMGEIWHLWSAENKIVAIELSLKLVDILTILHDRGFIHRDLTPVNFIITKKNKLVAIDLELSYCLNTKTPNPPFALGTHGFMSPQQEDMATPCIADDIYSLGASLVAMFTGLSPIVFSTKDTELLKANLYFFLRNESICDTLSICLTRNPDHRPKLSAIKETLIKYKAEIQKDNLPKEIVLNEDFNIIRVQDIINKIIQGLVLHPNMMSDGLWVSPTSKMEIHGSNQREFSLSSGAHHGLSGILYVLGRASLIGYDISSCSVAYNKAWKHILTNNLSELPDIAPGLYGGAAGIALALLTGLKSGLIEDSNFHRQHLEVCLGLASKLPDLANGVSGQGIVTLQCRDYITPGVFETLLSQNVRSLLQLRNNRGYWVIGNGKPKKHNFDIGFYTGNTGIIWFLLQYILQNKDSAAIEAVDTPLKLSLIKAQQLKNTLVRIGFINFQLNRHAWDSLIGITLVCIKAFEVFKQSIYKYYAEEILHHLPDCPINDVFDQENGLAGLGELYLEAFRVFKNDLWKKRANYIAILLSHTCRQGSKTCYWLNGGAIFSTADLMIGNGGILHFLMRSLAPDKLGYRLLE